jgi:hypothetical protein
MLVSSSLFVMIALFRPSGPWNQETETVIVGSKQLSVPLTGLKPNTVYKIRAFARNALGKSPPSEELLVKTEDEGSSAVFCTSLSLSLSLSATFFFMNKN